MDYEQEYKDLLNEVDSLSGAELQSELEWWEQAIPNKVDFGRIEHFGNKERKFPDFWDLFEADRYRTYDLEDILYKLSDWEEELANNAAWIPKYRFLDHYEEVAYNGETWDKPIYVEKKLTQEVIDHFKRELIKKNFGSCPFDW